MNGSDIHDDRPSVTQADDELRMYLVVRTDLAAMTAGKLAVQAGHGFLMLADMASSASPAAMAEYRAGATAKICLKASNLHALDRAFAEAEAAGLSAVRVVDAGRTCFPEPTATVVAIGPCSRTSLPNFVRRMQLF